MSSPSTAERPIASVMGASGRIASVSFSSLCVLFIRFESDEVAPDLVLIEDELNPRVCQMTARGEHPSTTFMTWEKMPDYRRLGATFAACFQAK